MAWRRTEFPLLRAWAISLALSLGATTILPASTLAQTTPDATDPVAGDTPGELRAKVNPDGYTSALICGRCHVNIYKSWKKSMHAFSLSNPIFETAYMQALRLVGESAKQACLRCHAPMTMYNGDFDLEEGVTREGVACDFCHTVTSVDLDNQTQPYQVEMGLVKRGIIKKASSPAHGAAYSALHGTSEFCGGCHDYYTPKGVPIMSTYQEWLSGPYAAEGKQCQDCHMTLSEGSVVREDLKKSAEFHHHSLIHDTDQMRSALAVDILDVKTQPNRVEATVRVANVGSGHMVPTGIPSREVQLVVECRFGNKVRRQERRYRKVMLDAEGKVLTEDVETMLKAVAVQSDNRIGPREERIESFVFELPQYRSVEVSAKLHYLYSPMILDRAKFDINMGEATWRKQ